MPRVPAEPAEAYTLLAGLYDEIVIDPCHEDWVAFLDALWCEDPLGVRSVLDVCCGTGLLAARLRARGYEVAGVDASQAMLDVARRRLGPDVALSRTTLPGMTVEGVFDAAVSTFDSFNYLTPDELRATLCEIALRVRPDGWLVFDLHTDRMMEFTISNPVVEGEASGNAFAIRSVVDAVVRTCDTTIELTPAPGGAPFSERHRQYFHPDAAVRDALQDAGFELTGISEEYTHRPVAASTLRATFIARRRPGHPASWSS